MKEKSSPCSEDERRILDCILNGKEAANPYLFLGGIQMTDLNPQQTSQGLLAGQPQISSEIPETLRPSSSEDMIPQPLDYQGILASQPQTGLDADAQDFDAATSVGASINESMMMPKETLAGNVPDLSQLASISAGDNEDLAPESMWQKQSKLMDQKIRQNPYAYIAGALGLGLVLGRSLGSSRSHSL
jgi:hypothetical protein